MATKMCHLCRPLFEPNEQTVLFCDIGVQDRVICFRCGGGVKDWIPEEDPWEEHAKHYPG